MDRIGGPFADWLHRPSARVSSSLVEGLGIALYVAEPGPRGAWLHVSPGVQEVLGVSRQDLERDHDLWASLVHPDDREALIGSETGLDVDTRIRIEYRMIRPDGRVVWLMDEAVVGSGADGKPLMDGYLVDVTSQRRAEHMMAAQAVVTERCTERMTLAGVLDGLPEAVVAASSACACVLELSDGTTSTAVRSGTGSPPESGRILTADASTPDGPAGRVALYYAEGVEPPAADADVPSWTAGLLTLAATRVAERHRAEMMYAQLAATLESTTDAFVVLARDGRIIGHNSRFCDMWSVDPAVVAAGEDAVVLEAILDAVEQPAAFVDVMRRLSGTEDTSADELRTVDGRILERTSKALWIGGEPAGRVWSFRDVTQTRRLQAELREREASLDRLVSQVRDYVILNLDPEGHVASWNEGAARIIRLAEFEVVGRPVGVLFPEVEPDGIRVDRLMQRALAEGSARDEGWCVRQPDQRFWAALTLTPLYDDDGRLRGFGLVLQDVGERRNAQLALERRARTLAAVGTIAAAANSATSVGSALDTALLTVCEHSGWQLAHVYLVDDGTGELRHHAWHLGTDTSREDFTRFIAATEESAPSDLPLPAAVLAKGRPVWVADLASLCGTERARAGGEVGLAAASATPVLIGDEVVGVLEFFSTDHLRFDAESDLVMRQLGTQLGRVVERARSERRAAEFARRAARLAQGAPADIPA